MPEDHVYECPTCGDKTLIKYSEYKPEDWFKADLAAGFTLDEHRGVHAPCGHMAWV